MDSRASMQMYFKLIIFSVIFLSGCASVRYAKKAATYEQAGMYDQAVEYFLQSLQRKRDNNDRATIGLMRASLHWKDDLAVRIDEAYATYNDEAVVSWYQQLVKLQSSVAVYRVMVDIPQRTEIQYEEARKRYQFSNYQAAQDLLDREQYTEAAARLYRIMQLDPEYERTRELYDFARCEPLYRTAQSLMRQGRYRSAYHEFEKIKRIDSNYKDAAGLQKEARLAGLMTIALTLPPDDARRYPRFYRLAEANIKTRIHQLQHPFIQLVSPEHTAMMIEEQRRALAENRPVNEEALIPVRVVFSGKMMQYQTDQMAQKRTERKAWLRQEDRQRNVSYKKVNYFEVEQGSLVQFTYAYDFVSAESARVIIAGKVSQTYRDAVKYAVSSFNADDLVPGDWGDGVKDTMYTDSGRRSAMRTLFSARKELKTAADYEPDFSSFVAADVVKKLQAYDPER